MKHTIATNPQEIKYINMRKRKAFRERLCFYLCRVFPIDNNLIDVCTFEGKGGFGCNPKYLVSELHKQNPDLKFVWHVNKESWGKKFPDYVKKVSNNLWSRAFWLSRSKVWIDNYRKPFGTVKRNGQYYINTNHYTVGIKCTGLWRGDGFSEMAYLVSKNDSDMVDKLVIDSDWCEEVSPKGFVYEGAYLKTGAPRCDILFGTRAESKRVFRERHNLPLDAKVVMYAPTFREGAVDGKRSVYLQKWSLDFKRLLINLEKKFGGEWYLCLRVHPQLAPTFEEYKDESLENRVIDESQADDMYEILAGMDAYITDYSSACYEAGLAKMPVFLYADDIEKYTSDRGDLMWNIDISNLAHMYNNKKITPSFNTELPYPMSVDNDMLEKAISEFDRDVYENRIDEFNKELGVVFRGNASEIISKAILCCI